MTTISIFYGIVIAMYWREHQPPHFYATYEEDEILVDILTLTVLEGKLPKRAEKMVLEWASKYRKELLGNWALCEKEQLPRKIAPLDFEVGPVTTPWHVEQVRVVKHLLLEVTFRDAVSGTVSIAPAWLTGALSPLKDPELFSQAFIAHGAVCWPGDLDLDPLMMHDAIAQFGHHEVC
ncbi:DUF4160 domain-containing protein [Dongshaea marina]|uniref:DUF4160 domain-containing protein n=1 Tax=Dongshaea marina TaxID=2047966 RepID=UPI00131F29CE|nr:DUF4160 domain-containing protein [Dongshaea marina]